jgi:hypothetical protein
LIYNSKLNRINSTDVLIEYKLNERKKWNI